MSRTGETSSAWRAAMSPPSPPVASSPRFEVTDLREHRAQRAAFVRSQIERSEADRRTNSLLAGLVLVADAILLGASAVTCGMQPGGWLAWPGLALALLSGGLLLVSAALAGLCFWRRESGGGGGADVSLADPHETASAFPNAAALQARFHRSLLTDFERQLEAEWLGLAKSARSQWRTLLYAVALAVAALAALALNVVVLAASGI